MIKLLHSADFHFAPDKDHRGPSLQSLNEFYMTGRKENVDAYLIPGDLFDRGIQNSEAAGLADLQDTIKDMMNQAPVFAVRGTTTHDIAGCYDIFVNTRGHHPFVLLEPSRYAILTFTGDVHLLNPQETFDNKDNAKLLVFGCPQPSKTWFLSDKRMGKAESDEAIKKGMRDIFLGLGALRKEYPGTPCVFVYHGHVAGSSMCNGQTLSLGDIEVGKDDLALVGADYYALGHIHAAQQIGDLPAYYSGSAYPVDWGETDQKSFNLVEIVDQFDGTYHDDEKENKRTFHYHKDKFNVIVNRIPYPHPPRKKIAFIPENDMALPESVEGFATWFEIRGTKGDFQRWGGSPEVDLERFILDYRCLPTSRVTYTVIPTETVRAGEIQEAQTLIDKLKVWAENSGEKLSQAILEKASLLEAEIRKEGLKAEGLHLRFRKLIVRGLKGIMKGLGEEEVELNLDGYDPGLIALIGGNGCGKTSLLENLHPYPTVHTRGGSLQSQFCLKDSYRDFHFVDERTGTEYRSFIQIDPTLSTPKAEYYLYRDGQPITSGKLGDYEGKVVELFGSLSLFRRSAFIMQKATKSSPDLCNATRGEKRAIFRELGGLDWIEACSKKSTESAKALGSEIERGAGKIETLQGVIADIPEKIAAETETQTLLELEKELQNELEEQGKQIAKEQEALKAKVDRNNELKAKGVELRNELNDIADKQKQLTADRDRFELAQHQKGQAEKTLQTRDALMAEKEKLDAEENEIYKQREKIKAKHDHNCEIARNHVQALRDQKAAKTKILADFQQKGALLKQKIDVLDEKLANPIGECPVLKISCDRLLTDDKRQELQEEREQEQASLKQMQSELWENDKELVNIGIQIDDLQQKIADYPLPEEPKLPVFGATRRNEIIVEVERLEIAEAEKILEAAKEAAIRIEEINKQLVSLRKQDEDVHLQIQDLQKEYDHEANDAYAKVTTELETTREKYTEAGKRIAGYKATLEEIEKQIKMLRKKEETLNVLRASLKDKQQEIAEWRFLERACGADGIQALELDALGPGMADKANRLLKMAIDSGVDIHFDQIKFDTTYMGGKGSKKKQIEDFFIKCHDMRDGDWTDLSEISVGESVWITRAISSAFSVIRANNSNLKVLTVSMDEGDSALDPEARQAYFKLLEAAHQESGRHHTIVITHSPEIQEMIAQKIEMSELQAPAKQEAVA